MRIGDFVSLYPAGILASLLKAVRFNMLEDDKDYISKNHLYHCTSSKEVAEKIVDSGYLKPATGVFKNINSYGKASVCMFAGFPTIENYIKNLSKNPYTDPSMIINAVEIDIHKEELNKNYKSRKLADDAVYYEGYCVLPKDRAKVVELVADLKRDEQGNPLKDSKTGELSGVEIRKRTEEEIRESPNEYKPKEDYLQYMKLKRKELGFLEGKNMFSKAYNTASVNIMGGTFEYKEMKRSFGKNFVPAMRAIANKFIPKKQIDESLDDKIKRIVSNKSFLDRKNPYRDKKFALAVAKFKSEEGIEQENLETAMLDFINSKEGSFLRDKYLQLDKSMISNGSIHGINHSDRVAMLAMMIGKDERILASDREREILVTAAYYHDIGRILPVGPHAKRSSRLAKDLEMRNLDGTPISENDKNIVRMIIDGHEGKDKDVEKLFKKYKIPPEDRVMAKNLLFCVKDADALDRCRLTTNTLMGVQTDLNPKYLRFTTSKKLMEFSYGLEYLTHNVKDWWKILNYENKNIGEHYRADIKEENNPWRVKGIDGKITQRENAKKQENLYKNTSEGPNIDDDL